MYGLKKEFTICCSHRLRNKTATKAENFKCFGKCNDYHGHNYKITLTFKKKDICPQTGMIINFNDIKRIFKIYIDDVYDHKILNDIPPFDKVIPTAENMCKAFFDILKKELLELSSVEIEETEGASGIYMED